MSWMPAQWRSNATANGRNERDRAFGHGLHFRELPSLGVTVEAVDVAAKHQPALSDWEM